MKTISQAQRIKLNKIANTSTAVVRRESTLTEKRQPLFGLEKLYRGGFGVWFVHVNITNIMVDIMCSNALSVSSGASNISYIKICSWMVNYLGTY